MVPVELKRYHYIKQNGKHIFSSTTVALVRIKGPKWMQVMVMDGPLTVRKVARSEERFMHDLTKKGKPYPLKTAVRHFRRFGKNSGITKGAKKFLRDVAQQEKDNATSNTR